MATSSVKIRQFNALTDQETVLELYRNGLYSYTEENSSPELANVCRHLVEGRCRENGDMFNVEKYYQTGDPRRNFFVAEDENGRIVGCVGAIPSTEYDPDEFMELTRMSVDNNFRGGGVGTKLVQEFENWAKSHGYKHLNLTTLHEMHAARNLYFKNGFSLVPEKEERLDTSKYGNISGSEGKALYLIHFVKHLC